MKKLIILIAILAASTTAAKAANPFSTLMKSERVGIIGASYANGDDRTGKSCVNFGEYFSLGEMLLKESNHFVKNRAVAGSPPAAYWDQLVKLASSVVDGDTIHIDYLVIGITNGCVWGQCTEQQMDREIKLVQGIADLVARYDIYPIVIGYPPLDIVNGSYTNKFREEMIYHFSQNEGSFADIYSNVHTTVDGVHPIVPDMRVAAIKLLRIIGCQ